MLVVETFNGLALGIEHISGDEDDDFHYAVALHLSFFRLVFYKLKT